jgi:hypothetical protein
MPPSSTASRPAAVKGSRWDGGWLPGLVVGAIVGSILTATAYAWPKIDAPGHHGQDPAQVVLAKATNISELKAHYNQMDELCRAGGGSDSLTLDACDAREKISDQMKTMGYCYGTYDTHARSEAEKTYDFYACSTLPPQ